MKLNKSAARRHPPCRGARAPVSGPANYHRCMQIHTRTWSVFTRAACAVPVAAWLITTGAAAAQPVAPSSAPVVAAASASAPRAAKSPFHQQRESSKANNFYASRWGIEELKVRSTSSGNLIRFSYRVVNAGLATALNDKRNTPAMVSQRARVVLQVPVMDKVGALRQSMPPETGKDYWMVFSNKGNFVKPGDRVDVLIGAFHADGLMVE